MSVLTFQDVVMALERFWAAQGCVIEQPYDLEVGAGTMHPATFLRALGPEPWRVAFVQPSRRPADGRYGENPNRLYKHYQFQVVLKPAPADVQDVYLQSLVALGIDPAAHDVRFEEDNWESPTLGAWGIGWQVLLDGQEITQFTYFQQAGGDDPRHPQAGLRDRPALRGRAGSRLAVEGPGACLTLPARSSSSKSDARRSRRPGCLDCASSSPIASARRPSASTCARPAFAAWAPPGVSSCGRICSPASRTARRRSGARRSRRRATRPGGGRAPRWASPARAAARPTGFSRRRRTRPRPRSCTWPSTRRRPAERPRTCSPASSPSCCARWPSPGA